MEKDMEGLFFQWTSWECNLGHIQSQLGDPKLKEEIQRLEMINREHQKLFKNSKESLQAHLQTEDTESEKTKSHVTHHSHTPSQRSYVASSTQSKACTSVSQNSSSTSSSHLSKASSCHSQSSWASRVDSLADQAANARIEAAVANATLRVGKAEQLQKEGMAAAVEELRPTLSFFGTNERQ